MTLKAQEKQNLEVNLREEIFTKEMFAKFNFSNLGLFHEIIFG